MDFTTSCGHEIKSGDKYVNFHIPSSGVSLTDEIRFDSYVISGSLSSLYL